MIGRGKYSLSSQRDMKQNTYTLLYGLIIKPEKTWQDIAGKQYKASRFASLHILLCVTAGIAIRALASGFSSWQDCLGRWVLDCLSLYAGLYLSAFVLHVLSIKVLQIKSEFKDSLGFCSFASGYLFLTFMTGIIFDNLLLPLILSFYVFPIIYDGLNLYLPADKKKNGLYSLIAGGVLIAAPLLAKGMIMLCMPEMA